jgi:3-methyladenine DNA glycosylase/8-oxoguanine DNA glycosylase
MVTSSRGGQAGVGGADWLQKARDHLRKADPVLARLIAARPDFDPRQWMTEVIAEKWRPYRSLATAYLFSAAFEEAQGLAARAGHSAGLPPEVER